MIKAALAILLAILTLNGFCQSKTNSDTSFKLADIHFKKTVFLDAASKKILDSVLHVMRNYPTLKLFMAGHEGLCESCEQASWDRLYSVLKYVKQQQFDSTQIIFSYGYYSDDAGTVSLTATSQDGPAFQPAPSPWLSYHKLTPKRLTDSELHAKRNNK